MGCDIHYRFQKKTDGKWEDINDDIKIGRNYLLFSWLADVRNLGDGHPWHIRPISAPRGLPSDSGYYECDWEGNHKGVWLGDHSYTWLDVNEIINAGDQPVFGHGAAGIRDIFAAFLYSLEKLKERFGSCEVRMIMGFDN